MPTEGGIYSLVYYIVSLYRKNPPHDSLSYRKFRFYILFFHFWRQKKGNALKHILERYLATPKYCAKNTPQPGRISH